MSEGFSNPIIGGGGGLVYPSIHSPNFVHDVSGWTIDKNGNAEFDNVTVRGVLNGNEYIINSTGFFLYAGAPAAGNLILAMASAPGDDEFGNPYSAPGISISAPGGNGPNEIQIRPDLSAILIYAP
jgi:hypothetical protein